MVEFRLNKRKLKKRQHQVEALAGQAESLAERYFFKRLDRLVPVRRFVIGWLLFFVLVGGGLVGQIRALDGQFRHLQPIPGGIYNEGILGDFTTANPLYATGRVDESVSKLIFSGLLTYDANNKLTGDLAESWTADATERVYTVKLRPNLNWHDGAPLTSRDVLFTYNAIQNPDTGSPLYQGWKDIKVTAPDARTVVFTLPNLLSAFPYQLTNGIIPEHLLKDVEPGEMRSVTFNTLKPVGSGPFMLQRIEVQGNTPQTREQKLALAPFPYYHRGAPKLSSFIIHAYHDEKRLEDDFAKREINAASFTELPSALKSSDSVMSYNYLLTAANMVFFRHSNPVLADPAVRKALVQAADVPGIIKVLGYPTYPVRGPFLLGKIGYDPALVQPPFDKKAAEAALDAAGWVKGRNGLRVKGAVPLSFKLQAQDTPENRLVTTRLQEDWSSIGVRADMQLRSPENLQRIISNQNYDALLYGISIGADSDVFVYWHSSQTGPRSNRLNFSEFKNKAADTSLEGGRTRADPTLRQVKYKPFLQAWQQDTPALGLYQPRYLYVTRGPVFGLAPRAINNETDRYNTVNEWQIRQASIPQTGQ